MERLVSLGILSKSNTNNTSPLMLITCKVTKDKRSVVNYRLLNTRILRRNAATPLINDILQILGNSKCETLSCIDLKVAFHSLGLIEKIQRVLWNFALFGSAHFRHEVLTIGLLILPCWWMEYMLILLDNIEYKSYYIMIRDDLLVHSMKSVHMERLTNLFKAVLKHGLKISPKKCQLFKTNLVYFSHKRQKNDCKTH